MFQDLFNFNLDKNLGRANFFKTAEKIPVCGNQRASGCNPSDQFISLNHFPTSKNFARNNSQRINRLHRRAQEFARRQKWQAAIYLWNMLIKIEVNPSEAHLGQAYAYLKLGKNNEAYQAAWRALEIINHQQQKWIQPCPKGKKPLLSFTLEYQMLEKIFSKAKCSNQNQLLEFIKYLGNDEVFRILYIFAHVEESNNNLKLAKFYAGLALANLPLKPGVSKYGYSVFNYPNAINDLRSIIVT